MSQHLIVDMEHVLHARKMAQAGDTVSFYAKGKDSLEMPALYDVISTGSRTGVLYYGGGEPSIPFEQAWRGW